MRLHPFEGFPPRTRSLSFLASIAVRMAIFAFIAEMGAGRAHAAIVAIPIVAISVMTISVMVMMPPMPVMPPMAMMMPVVTMMVAMMSVVAVVAAMMPAMRGGRDRGSRDPDRESGGDEGGGGEILENVHLRSFAWSFGVARSSSDDGA